MAKAAVDIISDDHARFFLALVLVVGTFVLLFLSRPVPDVLYALDGTAIGFYFGGALVRSQMVGN